LLNKQNVTDKNVTLLTRISVKDIYKWRLESTRDIQTDERGAMRLGMVTISVGAERDAQLSQRDHAAGCVIVFAKK